MKRKAPETLLEFIDYLQPLTKRVRFAPEEKVLPQHYSYDSEVHASPLSSPSSRASFESDSLEEFPDSSAGEREAFSMDEYLARDPLAGKPSNCRMPLKSLVEAIKWLLGQKRFLQKEISEALGVRCV